jgi:hypothetical protein
MPKTSRKALREQIKGEYLIAFKEFLGNKGEDVLQVGSNKLAIPVVDAEGNEDFLTITLAIPTGSREDNEPYDGYGEAESYQKKLAESARKAQEREKKKAEKIRRDTEYRAKKAQQKEKRERA